MATTERKERTPKARPPAERAAPVEKAPLEMIKREPVTIKDLVEAGAHFGHQKHRWNPKMKVYIFGERNGIYIIDLAKTAHLLKSARNFVQNVVASKKSVLFVGTKKAAKTIIKEEAERAGEFFVAERWLGGMLTNLATIRQSVKKLERYEKKIASGGEGHTKKELSLMAKDLEKLEKNLSGVRAMRKPPGLVIVVDPGVENIAVAEARKLGIPVMAVADTNCDPDPIDHIIPCNDDSSRAIRLVLQTLADAIIEKKNELHFAHDKDEESSEENAKEQEELKEALELFQEKE